MGLWEVEDAGAHTAGDSGGVDYASCGSLELQVFGEGVPGIRREGGRPGGLELVEGEGPTS